LAYLGQSVRLSAGQDEELEGLLVGLRGDGSLALQCNGGILYFQAGEMHLRPGDDRML
jgi:biotin-(acetyl-CoA carboxylase) ligase